MWGGPHSVCYRGPKHMKRASCIIDHSVKRWNWKRKVGVKLYTLLGGGSFFKRRWESRRDLGSRCSDRWATCPVSRTGWVWEGRVTQTQPCQHIHRWICSTYRDMNKLFPFLCFQAKQGPYAIVMITCICLCLQNRTLSLWVVIACTILRPTASAGLHGKDSKVFDWWMTGLLSTQSSTQSYSLCL